MYGKRLMMKYYDEEDPKELDFSGIIG